MKKLEIRHPLIHAWVFSSKLYRIFHINPSKRSEKTPIGMVFKGKDAFKNLPKKTKVFWEEDYEIRRIRCKPGTHDYALDS